MNTFGNGINLNGGTPYLPALRFTDSQTTGFYYLNDKLHIGNKGVLVASISNTGIAINSGFNFAKNASESAYLRSDAEGNAYWQQPQTRSGSVDWSSIYDNLDMNGTNDRVVVNYRGIASTPNVTFSLETDHHIADNAFYIRDKGAESCSIYSTLPVLSAVSSIDTTEFDICRLSNGLIGVCYYDIEQDRVFYKHSLDTKGIEWSNPVLVDDVSSTGNISIAIVDGRPSIAYIASESDLEWRFARATNETGSVWAAPVVLHTDSGLDSFVSVWLLKSDVPVCLFNDCSGRAKAIYAEEQDGSLWNAPVNVSNLVNHKIIKAGVVNGSLAVVARSNTVKNVYYVHANQVNVWPIAATQLYKNNNGSSQTILSNDGNGSCDLYAIGGKPCVAISELTSNKLYLNIASDSTGDSWHGFNEVMDLQTAAAYPRFFTNNGIHHLLFNKYTGTPSIKGLLKFNADMTYSVDSEFLPGFDTYMNHMVLPNLNDGNSYLFFSSHSALSMLRFYSDLKINWIAHSV